jgi:transcription elongation GreA/GreB family factor
MNLSLRQKLFNACVEHVNLRIDTSKQAMADAQESANAEEKSSAGDKYETGRAMMQIERDKAAQQLNEAMKLKQVLDQINNTEVRQSVVSLGSVVITSSSPHFYVAISAGKIQVDGVEYIALAPQSPIGKALLNLKVKDTFMYNNKSCTIVEIT